MISFDQIEHASLTDVGVRRSHNQDNFAVQLATDAEQWRQVGHLFLVADGMGGHAVGEKASEQAKDIIPHTYSKYAHEGSPAALRKAFMEANATIHACGEQNHEFKGMGTTGSALVLRPDGVWIGHVGDSRVYRIRKGVIDQLTYDHSYVWEYARMKHIDPADVQDFPTNIIHRCLGPQPLVQVDIEGPHTIEPGDVYLLCSDGLSGQVSDHEMGAVAATLPPDEACRFLVDLANLRGGPDNITVVIARVLGAPASSSVFSPTPPTPPPAPKPLLERLPLPWSLAALVGGSVLAAVAIALKVGEIGGDALAVLLFLLATGLVVAGVVGQLLEQRRRKEVGGDEENYQPRVHRSSPCPLDPALLEKLANAEKALKQRTEERQWESDVVTYEQHHERAEKYVQAGDLASAFQEYCRAMRPLNEAMSKFRNKEEVFQPVWDKSR